MNSRYTLKNHVKILEVFLRSRPSFIIFILLIPYLCAAMVHQSHQIFQLTRLNDVDDFVPEHVFIHTSDNLL